MFILTKFFSLNDSFDSSGREMVDSVFHFVYTNGFELIKWLQNQAGQIHTLYAQLVLGFFNVF